MELFGFGGNFLFSIKWLETKDYYYYCFYFVALQWLGVRSPKCSDVSVEIASGVYGQNFLH